MARDLPIFEPNPAHAPRPGASPSRSPSAAGRSDAPAADGIAGPLRRHPDWIKARMPSGDQLPRPQGPAPRPEPQHGLRGGPLPEHRGVLGPAHRDGHDPGRHLHPRLRLLRGQDRPARPGSTTTSRAAWPRPSAAMGLEHVVVTSVARDDLPDGGAGAFAATIREMRAASPGMGVEVLIPDFNGEDAPLRTVMEAGPGHPQPQPRDRASGSRSRSASAPAGTARWTSSSGPRPTRARDTATRSTPRAA